MLQIYAGAESVVLWLGPAGDDGESELAIEFLKACAADLII